MVRIITRLIILQFFLLIGFIFTWSRVSSIQPSVTTLVTMNPPPTKPTTSSTWPSPAETDIPKTVQQPTTEPVSNRCIIAIDGQQYDMTDFRKIHSGGDIFQCGTDMSAIFWGRHDQSYLNKIARYRISQ